MDKQIFVKTNVQGDQGVASLVSALSEIVGVVTTASGDTVQELATFMDELSSQLNVPFRYSLSLEWRNGDGPYAQIRTEPENGDELASAIRQIAPTLTDRMTVLGGDTGPSLNIAPVLSN